MVHMNENIMLPTRHTLRCTSTTDKKQLDRLLVSETRSRDDDGSLSLMCSQWDSYM